MKKKLLIIGGVVVGAALAIPSGIVLAKYGIDGWLAYVEALEYGLHGLKAYFDFLIELFKVTIT